MPAYGGGQQVRFENIKLNLRSTRSVNGTRTIDTLDIKGIAHESKVGYVGWSAKAKYQILKDAALIRNRGIKGAHWHFYRSANTGTIGADPRILRLLNRKGIGCTIYD